MATKRASSLNILTTQLTMFAGRNWLWLIMIAAALGAAVIYSYARRRVPFPDWDKQNSAAPSSPVSQPPQVEHSASTQAADIAEDQSREALYDPEKPSVDPKYRLPANLSTDEVHKLILDMECLVDLAKAHDQLFTDYNNLYATLVNPQVKEVFFWRIKNQAGFKEPALPARWQEFSEAGAFSDVDELGTAYVAGRVERLRYRIIGGKFTSGDVKFVRFAMAYYTGDIPKLAGWIAKAKQLNRWMIDDQIITPDTLVKTSLDDYTNPQGMIDAIRLAHASVGPSPQPIAQVNPDGASNRLNYSDTSVAAAAGDRRQLVAQLTPAQKAEFLHALDELAQDVTIDVRFVPPPPKKPAPRGLLSDMDADLERHRLEEQFPLLTHAMEAFETRAKDTNPMSNISEMIRQDSIRVATLSVLITALKKQYDSGQPFTFGEIDDVRAGVEWGRERLKYYAGQTESLSGTPGGSSRNGPFRNATRAIRIRSEAGN
jgi:hypothetical protein